MENFQVVGTMRPSERQQCWTAAASSILFPLRTVLHEPEQFSGNIKNWRLGPASLVYFRSGAVTYKRERQHVAQDSGETLLLTYAVRSDVSFDLNRNSVTCKREQFLVERGNAPSNFSQTDNNELLVLKFDAELLRQRVRSIDRFTNLVFDSSLGAGGLLLDVLRAVPRRVNGSKELMLENVGDWLIELVALALEDKQSVLGSELTSVQHGHVVRIEAFVRQNLRNRELSPQLIASGCGISLRYLHQLLNLTGHSVGGLIRELRLEQCDKELRNPHRRDSISEIAYRWGYSDLAQFSRHYKAHFGRTATETRQLSRNGNSQSGASKP